MVNHVPYKEVKIRSQSAPWITNEIRYKRNKRFKVFKEAISTKREDKWSEYKKIRNEVISDIRKAKASYFNNMFNEVKNAGAYWNLIGLFATSDHVVQNPPCWRASSLLFPPWEIKTKKPEPVKLDLPLF